MTYPVTFDQPTEVDYCPYCNNRFPLDWMSDEHVIPEVIGGDQRSVIQARKPCNNYMGARVDSALARHSYVRILALIKGLSKKSPNHVEKHPSQARLKNGTWLDGYCFVHFPTATTWQLRFKPSKHQQDSSIWIPEEAIGAGQVPDGVNIYRHEDLDKASFSFIHPAGSGMEPAFVKILLGFLYFCWGTPVVKQPAIDPLRQYLKGEVPATVVCRWPEPGEENAPKEILPDYHTIWFGSEVDQVLNGGISLFGKVTMLIEVKDFDLSLPGRMISLRLK